LAPDPVPHDVQARSGGQSFEVTAVHPPDPSPAAGDDLYEEFDVGRSADLLGESAEGDAAPSETPGAAAEEASSWDEDPESLSQSALERLPEASAEAPADPMPEPPAAPMPTAIPVEAPPSASATVEPKTAPAQPVAASALPAELQERMHATLERIAWEAMGDLSERVIKETLGRIESIAWEVIPQMAETMIREELERIASSDDPE
jgi:hypothetical protein